MKAERNIQELTIFLVIALTGRYSDRGSTDCCQNHDGVTMR